MIIDFDTDYYPEIHTILKNSGIQDKDIRVLDCETKLLIDDRLEGFYTAEKVNEFYNVHHFYVRKRTPLNVWKLSNYAFQGAKELGCKWGLIHTPKNSRLDQWVRGLCRHRNLVQLESPEEYNFYKVEI